MKRPIFILTIFSIVCIVITISQINTEFDTNKMHSMPKEYMKNITITNFDDTGNLQDKLTAKSWKFISTKGYSKIQKPDIKVFKANSGKWQITSTNATVYHENNSVENKIQIINFNNNVILERIADVENTPILIKTDNAKYYPLTETVNTNAFVTMQKPGLTLSGTGLKGDLNKNWIELQNDVKTTIDANS